MTSPERINAAVDREIALASATVRLAELTVKEYALRERVSERTVWTWVRKEAVRTRRTPGGGVRILVAL